MERKVGEIFEFEGKTYEVVESESACPSCAFKKMCVDSEKVSGPCAGRADKKLVIFKEVMKIKNNKLTINIPEGMEIDIENSDLKKGVIKFKNKGINYIDVCISLNTSDKAILVSDTNCEKVKAISKLMDIADYYNKGWKPNWSNDRENKYYISYINRINDYTISGANTTNNSFVYFKNMEDANAVMCNSNFRDILDAIYKN